MRKSANTHTHTLAHTDRQKVLPATILWLEHPPFSRAHAIRWQTGRQALKQSHCGPGKCFQPLAGRVSASISHSLGHTHPPRCPCNIRVWAINLSILIYYLVLFVFPRATMCPSFEQADFAVAKANHSL